MLTDNSTQAFLQKLYQKQRQHSTKLYTSSLKQNKNVQAKSNCKPQHKKTIKLSSSSEPTTPSHNWYLDISAYGQNMSELMQDWICLPQGVYRFRSIYRDKQWEQQIQNTLKECEGSTKEGRKCVIVQINCVGTSINFISNLTKYALPLLKCGKSSWSVAALSTNRRFDMLSLDSQGSPLWKAKTPLSKIQLQREQLLRRVFGYAQQKQKNICIQQMLGKVTLPSNNNIYFVLKTAEVDQPISKLLIEQEMMIENIAALERISIVSLQSTFSSAQLLGEVFRKLGIVLKKEEELAKAEKEQFLKCLINKLQGQLISQKEQLKHYIQSDRIQQQQYSIPSQRLSMSQKYKQLQRKIKQKNEEHNIRA